MKSDIDLTDDDCCFWKFYFDYLTNRVDFFKAWNLFPESPMILRNFQKLQECQQRQTVLGMYRLPKDNLSTGFKIHACFRG